MRRLRRTPPLLEAVSNLLEALPCLRRGAMSITKAMTAKRMTARDATGNSGVVEALVEEEALEEEEV